MRDLSQFLSPRHLSHLRGVVQRQPRCLPAIPTSSPLRGNVVDRCCIRSRKWRMPVRMEEITICRIPMRQSSSLFCCCSLSIPVLTVNKNARTHLHNKAATERDRACPPDERHDLVTLNRTSEHQMGRNGNSDSCKVQITESVCYSEEDGRCLPRPLGLTFLHPASRLRSNFKVQHKTADTRCRQQVMEPTS